ADEGVHVQSAEPEAEGRGWPAHDADQQQPRTVVSDCTNPPTHAAPRSYTRTNRNRFGESIGTRHAGQDAADGLRNSLCYIIKLSDFTSMQAYAAIPPGRSVRCPVALCLCNCG